MTDPARQHVTLSNGARTPVEQIASQVDQPVDRVQEIYDRTIESIAKDAKISQFVGVIATRQVLIALRRRIATM